MSNFQLKVQALLDKAKTLAHIKRGLKEIQPKIPPVKLTGELNESKTRTGINKSAKKLKPKVVLEADTTKLDKTLNRMSDKKQSIKISPSVDSADYTKTANEVEKKSRTLFTRLGNSVSSLDITRRIVQEFIHSISNAISNVKELNKIATDVQMASGSTKSEADGLMLSYHSLAKEISSTTKATAENANTFIRMGESISDTNTLIKTSHMLSKIGMLENADSADYLLSMMKGYQLAAQDSLIIVDKLTAVDRNAAVSAGELAQAMSGVSTIANNSGTSMDRLIGYMAAVGEATHKSMSEVGNSFQSIYSRMNNMKTGKFIDDETGEDLSDTEAILGKIGIQLKENETAYRDFDLILDDVGKNWTKFTKEEQNNIAAAIAGTRQLEIFTALMNHYGSALTYAGIAADSAGAALKRYEVYQDSIEARTNQLTNALEGLSVNLIDEDLYAGILEAATALTEFVDKTNLLKGALAGVATAGILNAFSSIAAGAVAAVKSTTQLTSVMAMFNQGMDTENLNMIGEACIGLSDKQLKLVLSMKGLNAAKRVTILQGMQLTDTQISEKLSTLGLATAENVATGATFTFAGALNTLKTAFATNPIGMSIMAISTAVSIGTMAFSHYRQALEETRQKNMEASNSANESARKIEELYIKYHDLTSIQERNASQEEEYKSIIVDITKALGDKAAALDGLTSGTKEYTKALEDASRQEMENLYVTSVTGRKAAEDELKEKAYSVWDGSKVAIDINPQMTGVKEHTDALTIVRDTLSEFEHSSTATVGGGLTVDNSYWDVNSSDIENLLEYYDKLNEARKKLVLASQDKDKEYLLDSDIYNHLNSTIASLSESVEAYISARYQELKFEYEWQNSIPSTKEELQSMKEAILANASAGEYFSNKIRGFMKSDFSNLAQAADQAAGSVKGFTSYFSDTDNKKAVDSFQEKIDKLKGYLHALPELDDSKKIDMYQEFPELINRTGKLEDSIQSLINNALQELYHSMDKNIPDNIRESLDGIAESALHSRTEISDLENELSKLDSLQKVLSGETDGVTVKSLKEIQDYGAPYKDLVNEYLLSVIDEKEFMSRLNDLYSTELQNYQIYMMDKYAVSETFWNTMINTEGKLIDSFADNYGVDISNCKSYAEAKLKIENTLLSKVKTSWSKYYNTQTNSLTAEGARLQQAVNQARNSGVPDEMNPYARQLGEILSAQEAYRSAMQELDSITFDKMEKDIPDLSSEFELLNKKGSDSSHKIAEDTRKSLDAELKHLSNKLRTGVINYEDYAEKCKAILEDMYKQGKISAEDYFDYTQNMLEEEKSYYDSVLSAVTKRLDREIDAQQAIIDGIERKMTPWKSRRITTTRSSPP